MADAEREENETLSKEDEEEMEGVEGEEEKEEESDSEDEEAERQIAELEQQVKANPYLYDGHTLLITKLRAAGEFERVQLARENMNAIFPLTADLWLEWIEDEKKVMQEDERGPVTELFERAIKDYTSVSLWVEYIQFSIGGMAAEGGLEAVRAVCERALTATGLHVAEGWMVWEAYREYENAILMGLQPAPGAIVTADQQKQLDAQTRRLVALFRRQLSVPLTNMESTWAEFVDFAEEEEQKKVRPLYEKSLSRLETLRPYEDALLTADNLSQFEDYIDHELSAGEPARIQCIFERAIVTHCLIPRVWIRYTQYLDIELKIPDVVLSVYERAVRNCPWSSELWCGYGRAMERYSQPHSKTKDVFVRGLSGGFTNGLDYLSVWNAHLDYLRRRVNWTTDSEEEGEKRDELWETFVQAQKHLTDSFGTEGDPECTLLRYKARLKAKLCNDMGEARDAWNEVMQAGHGNKAAMWLEFFNLERSYGDHKHARKILQRALNSANDWPESVVQAYIRFEREEGDTVDVYDAAVSRCEAQMGRIEERRAKIAEKEAAEEAKKKSVRKEKKAAKKAPDKGPPPVPAQPKKPQSHTTQSPVPGEVKVFVRGQPKDGQEQPVRPYKRKVTDSEETTEGTFKVPTASPSKAPPPGLKGPPPGGKAPPPGYKGPKAPPPGYKGPKATPPPGYKGPAQDAQEPPEKKAKVEDQTEDAPFVVDSSKESRTVFVSNLDFSLTEDDIKEALGEVGEITDLRLIKTFTGKSKGYAYVEFKDELMVIEALKKDRTPIGGRPMFLSKCNERTNNAATFKYATTLEKNKLFVRGLPFTATQEDVAAEFAKHGELKEVRLVTYRSGASKGLAYVVYQKESDASQAVLKMDGMTMGDHTIAVAISNPPQRKAPAGSQTFQPALGGGKRDTGGRGRASTQLSLVPRSLQRKPPTPAEDGKNGAAANGSGDQPAATAKMSNQDFRKMLLKQ